MNCAEVENRVVEYLDRSLDAITAKHLEIHLSTCPPCRIEVDSLADCIRQVAALPIVDPPLGFAQRVMAHAREIERKPTLWQRFAPTWQFNKPIQATAVVLIAVLSVYIYQKEEQQILAPIQHTPSTPQVADLTDRKVETKGAAPAALSDSETDKTTRLTRQDAPVKTAPPAPATADTSPSIAPPAASKTESEDRSEIRQAAPRRPPIQVQEVATGREGSRASRESFDLGVVPLGAALQPSLRSAPAGRPFFSMNEPIADLEFIVRRRPSQRREQAEGKNADPALRVGSEAGIESQVAPARSAVPVFAGVIIETRWYSVAPEHLEHFKKDLAAETFVESEWVTTQRERESPPHPLAIKVIILPPTDR